MSSVAIVAIVAMLLAFFVFARSGLDLGGGVGHGSAPEVILEIRPPQIVYVTAPPAPDRNPRR